MKITETIHHGTYRNVRVVHMHPPTLADVARWLAECPYPVTRTEDVAGQLLSKHAAHSSNRDRSVDRGWVHWEVS